MDKINYRITKSIQEQEVDGMYIIFSEKNNKIMNLNKVASEIWECIKMAYSYDMIVETISKKYNNKQEICLIKKDVDKTIDIMIECGLIEID